MGAGLNLLQTGIKIQPEMKNFIAPSHDHAPCEIGAMIDEEALKKGVGGEREFVPKGTQVYSRLS